MAAKVYIGQVLDNEEIQQDCFLMTVRTSPAFQEPLPGQFVMLRIAGLNEPFLSRPISIYSFSREENYCAIELLYRVVGKGTQIMAGLIEDSQVEINGPLGNGFDTTSVKENVVIVSGGIGVAPLSMLSETLRRTNPSTNMMIYKGFQSVSAVVGLEKLQRFCRNISVCTDDGSLGEKGFVTQIFQKDMKNFSPGNTSIYACGPQPMLKALAKILNGTKFNCQVSLEERMACGVGACMGCAVAVKDKDGSPAYRRVCADGPVFNMQDIIWE